MPGGRSLALKLQQVVFEDLARVVPRPVDALEHEVPFGGLNQDLGADGPTDLPGDDVHAVTGGPQISED